MTQKDIYRILVHERVLWSKVEQSKKIKMQDVHIDLNFCEIAIYSTNCSKCSMNMLIQHFYLSDIWICVCLIISMATLARETLYKQIYLIFQLRGCGNIQKHLNTETSEEERKCVIFEGRLPFAKEWLVQWIV